jgi:hypothetical protein
MPVRHQRRGDRIKLGRVCWAVVVLALAVGCAGRAGPTATANAPEPTVWVPTVTLAPSGMVTVAASLTSSAATATLLSATPPATVTPTPTPRPSQPPTAMLLPAGYNPLTGELAADPSLLALRPMAVKVVNEPSCARPQFGLERAAVVFEHYVEAWGTRFTAVFYGQEAGRIGAVRSARLIDLELPAIFDAALVTSGSSGGVRQRLENSDLAERVIAFEWQRRCPPLCLVPIEDVPCQDLEHTMFTRLPDLWAEAEARGLNESPDLAGWAFSASPARGGAPAPEIRVGYLNSPVDWRFEAENGDYHRWQDGVRHTDAETRRRLTARNVVVLFAHHTYTDIRESPNFYSLEIQFWGRGPALIFRDGLAYRATWVRETREGLFQLVDATGAPVPLKPGRTWFEFVALDSPVEVSHGRWTITASVLAQLTPPRP